MLHEKLETLEACVRLMSIKLVNKKNRHAEMA
jgi:hypothetical protein